MKAGKFKLVLDPKEVSKPDDMVSIEYSNGLIDKPSKELLDKLGHLSLGKWYPVSKLMEIK